MQIFLWLVVFAILGFSTVTGAQVPVPGERRAADRDAIRAHIDSIFKAYIQKDCEKVRATHSREWRGFFQASRSIIRGIEDYQHEADRYLDSPARITSYEMLEFDVLFYDEALAVVPYIADMRVQMGDAEVPFKLRVLDIYAKSEGDWIQVASSTVTHPDTLAAVRQQPSPVSAALRQEILAAREAVWRAWFANDRARLEAVIPEETIAINAGEERWQNRAEILAAAEEFVTGGGKLVRLEYPRTEIQLYGDVAILYTTYLFEVENQGERQTSSGRGTEIFVRRDGRWVNSGWHLDSGR